MEKIFAARPFVDLKNDDFIRQFSLLCGRLFNELSAGGGVPMRFGVWFSMWDVELFAADQRVAKKKNLSIVINLVPKMVVLQRMGLTLMALYSGMHKKWIDEAQFDLSTI